MKLTRTALALTAGALTPALLLATPALATAAPAKTSVTAPASATPGSDTENAATIAKILADPASGKGVIRAANAALSGTPEDRVAFLTTGFAKAQDEDNRVAIGRILATTPATSKAVRREITKAMDGTPADRTAFLKPGLRLAQTEDDRVAVGVIMARPGISEALYAAAQKVVDGTPEELRHFITVGQYQF
ncbi:ALF repeat-containing protein [Streptomyces sp. CLCI03]